MSTFDKILQHKALPELAVIQPILDLSVLIIRDYECNLENLELLFHSLECLGSCTRAYSPAVYVTGGITLMERLQVLASSEAGLLPSVCRIWKHMSSEYYAQMVYQRDGFVDLANGVIANNNTENDVLISMLQVLKMMPQETFLSKRLLDLSRATSTVFKVRQAALLCLFKMLERKSNNYDDSLLSEIMEIIIDALAVKIDIEILLGALNVIPNILDYSGVGVIPLFGQLGGMDSLESLAYHPNPDVSQAADQLLDRFCNDESSTAGASYGEDDDELWNRCHSPLCHKYDQACGW